MARGFFMAHCAGSLSSSWNPSMTCSSQAFLLAQPDAWVSNRVLGGTRRSHDVFVVPSTPFGLQIVMGKPGGRPDLDVVAQGLELSSDGVGRFSKLCDFAGVSQSPRDPLVVRVGEILWRQQVLFLFPRPKVF